MLKVPPDGTFTMNRIVIVKFRVINKFPHMLPSLPHGFKDRGALDRDRKRSSNKINERMGFPRFGLLGITSLNVIP
jgi:hypothetical protein